MSGQSQAEIDKEAGESLDRQRWLQKTA